MFGMTRVLLSLLLIPLLVGCSKKGSVKTEQFFVDWLKAHGETNIVTDANGVGIAGNETRLKASLYDAKKDEKGDGYTAEMEFRIRLPSNLEIVEFVVGMGKTKEEATKDSLLNFLLTTFHVVYRSFMNPADPHQKTYPVKINGAAHEMAMGDFYVRGTQESLDFDTLRALIRAAICETPLSHQSHWIKIVGGSVPGKPIYLSASLDNQENEKLTGTLKALPWPASDHGYMVKEFIVVK
jgi:hypothetical protein